MPFGRSAKTLRTRTNRRRSGAPWSDRISPICCLEARTLLTAARQVIDIDQAPRDPDAHAELLTVVGTKVFYTTTGPHAPDFLNRTLVVSDGTTAGTSALRTFSDISEMVAVGNTLYFAAYDLETGKQLWRSDGTVAGTTMVKLMFDGFAPQELTNVDGALYFVATESSMSGKKSLWRTSGANDLVLVSGGWDGQSSIIPAYPSQLTAVNGKVYFTGAKSGRSNKLWGKR